MHLKSIAEALPVPKLSGLVTSSKEWRALSLVSDEQCHDCFVNRAGKSTYLRYSSKPQLPVFFLIGLVGFNFQCAVVTSRNLIR